MAGVIEQARMKTSLVPPKPLDVGDFAAPVTKSGTLTVNPAARTGPPDMSGIPPGAPTTNPAARTPADTTTPTTTPVASTPDVSPPPAGSGSPGVYVPGAQPAGATLWSPTSGIVDQIRGITPQNVDATGYTSGGIADTPDATATGYDATGYTAQQGTAKTVDENLSGAIDRITSENGPLMRRAAATGTAAANARGLLNSSMAVGAAQGAVLDKATEIGQGDVQAGEFNAEQQNVMTINNVQQANAALAFHAQAQNEASQFAANAKNSASQFNSAEAQQKAIAASQLWDQAAQFSAAAQNAAKSQNAQAYNDAMQRYVDAKNAAIAAQNDAENLSRRDTAQLMAQQKIAETQASASRAHASATVAAARVNAATQRAISDANLSERQTEFVTQQGNQQFNTFQAGLTAIELQGLEPDARQNAIRNYMSVWSAAGSLPFDIDMSQFPASGNPPPAP